MLVRQIDLLSARLPHLIDVLVEKKFGIQHFVISISGINSILPLRASFT
jgi:hypothetical protein